MDEMKPAALVKKSSSQVWPTVLVKYPQKRRLAGRIVNNRTGDTIKVLIVPLNQKYHDLVDIRMVEPDMVE